MRCVLIATACLALTVATGGSASADPIAFSAGIQLDNPPIPDFGASGTNHNFDYNGYDAHPAGNTYPLANAHDSNERIELPSNFQSGTISLGFVPLNFPYKWFTDVTGPDGKVVPYDDKNQQAQAINTPFTLDLAFNNLGISLRGTATGTLRAYPWNTTLSGSYTGTADTVTSFGLPGANAPPLPASLLDLVHHPERIHIGGYVDGRELNYLEMYIKIDPTPAPAPEPGTLVLFGAFGAGLVIRRWRKRGLVPEASRR